MPSRHVLLKKEGLHPANLAGRSAIVLDILFARLDILDVVARLDGFSLYRVNA